MHSPSEREAASAEALWALLARILPDPWRVEALCCWLFGLRTWRRAAGRHPLEAALLQRSDHRMAGMLDTALQSGMRPEQIRELAAPATGSPNGSE